MGSVWGDLVGEAKQGRIPQEKKWRGGRGLENSWCGCGKVVELEFQILGAMRRSRDEGGIVSW